MKYSGEIRVMQHTISASVEWSCLIVRLIVLRKVLHKQERNLFHRNPTL